MGCLGLSEREYEIGGASLILGDLDLEGGGFEPIPGHPDYYINRSGEVYSFKRKLPVRLVQTFSNGYPMVSVDGRTTSVHRLVAKTFVPGETAERRWVNHIDGDKTYCHADNLEWVTPVENIAHAQSEGLIKERPVKVVWTPEGYRHAKP